MKVTMITRGTPDYLADIVADGLIRKLGRENVHLVANTTNPYCTMKSQFCGQYDVPNTIGFYDTDALVVSCRSKLSDITDWMSRTGRHAIASLDGEDDPVIRTEWVNRSKVHFKREYLAGRHYEGRIQPLPFGAIPEPQPPAAPRSGVFFRNRQNDPVRVAIVRILGSMGYPVPIDMVNKQTYNEALSRALVGVSARGAGWDTYRYWEVPYFGALLFTQRLGIVIPGDFRDGQEAVAFDGVGDFQSRLQALLADPARIEAIARAGAEAVNQRHLSTHRATRILEALA